MRCAVISENKGFEKSFINKIFDAIWIDGLNLNDKLIVEKVLKNLDINPKIFLGEATEQKNNQRNLKKTLTT